MARGQPGAADERRPLLPAGHSADATLGPTSSEVEGVSSSLAAAGLMRRHSPQRDDPSDVETAGARGAAGTGIGACSPLIEETLPSAEEAQQAHGPRADSFSPLPACLLLPLFCCVHLLNLIDRGMFTSNGVNGRPGCGPHHQHQQPSGMALSDGPPPDPACAPFGIQGDLGLSNFQDGLLPTSLLLGLILTSPLFAHASKTHPPPLLMALGLGTWCLAAVGCALSSSFLPLALCRMLVGFGEASFFSLAAPCLKDAAPAGRVSVFLACFYLCGPVGYALGYLYGGAVGPTLGWRAAFLIEAATMLPLALLLAGLGLHAWRRQRHQRQQWQGGQGQREEGRQPEKPEEGQGTQGQSSLVSDWRRLLQSQPYVYNLMGNSAFVFVQGVYAFWGAKAVRSIFLHEGTDSVLGVMTVATGVLGSLSGGLVLDALGSSVPNAFRLMSLVTFLGAGFSIASFLAPSIWVYVPLGMLGECFNFAIQAPVSLVYMQSVPRHLQAQAIALSAVTIHFLGDIPSPPLFGYLQDVFGDFRTNMVAFTCLMAVAAAIWQAGYWRFRSTDFSGRDDSPLKTRC